VSLIRVSPSIISGFRPNKESRKQLALASDGGGASLIETCKLNGVDPHVYLTDVIRKIVNGHLNIRIDAPAVGVSSNVRN
jgi:IS66 C-terminal element